MGADVLSGQSGHFHVQENGGWSGLFAAQELDGFQEQALELFGPDETTSSLAVGVLGATLSFLGVGEDEIDLPFRDRGLGEGLG